MVIILTPLWMILLELTMRHNNSHPSGGVALFGEGTQNVATNAYFNDVRVRKYAAIEPGIDVGTAEEILFRWTGGLNTDWGTGGNWSSGVAPTSADDITIPNVTNDPTISGTANCNNLIIEPTASLTLNPGGALTVNGDLNNNGLLTIGSTLASSGSLIVNWYQHRELSHITGNCSREVLQRVTGTWSQHQCRITLKQMLQK